MGIIPRVWGAHNSIFRVIDQEITSYKPFFMRISMGKWPDFEYHVGKWLKYDRSGYNSSHPSLGSPLDLGNPWRHAWKWPFWGKSLFCHCVLCKLDLMKTCRWVVAVEILGKHHLWIVWHRQDLLIGQRPPIYFTGLRKYTKAWFHLLTNWI